MIVEAVFNLTLLGLCCLLVFRWAQNREIRKENERLRHAIQELTRENARLREYPPK